MSDNKGFGEILLIIGIALLLVGIGVGIYIAMFSSSIAYAYAGNYIPTWFAGLIAVTFIILGIPLIVLGARELGFHYME